MHPTPNVCERETSAHKSFFSDENPRKMDDFVFSVPEISTAVPKGCGYGESLPMLCTALTVSWMGLSNTSEIFSVTMALFWL